MGDEEVDFVSMRNGVSFGWFLFQLLFVAPKIDVFNVNGVGKRGGRKCDLFFLSPSNQNSRFVRM